MPCTLIVEDEVSLRNDLVAFLQAKGHAAAGAGTISEALHQMNERNFDLVVLDISLPDGNGIELLADIRARYGLDCGVVVLTSHQDLESKIDALETGSDAYLVKHASLREIECTLHSVLKRLPEAASRPRQEWRLDRRNWCLTAPPGSEVPLTAKEMTFLVTLMASEGKVCDHAKLLAALGEGENFSSANLNTLVRRLRRKIEDTAGLVPPIRVAYGKGYTFTAPITVI